jgi:hypothetical protein
MFPHYEGIVALSDRKLSQANRDFADAIQAAELDGNGELAALIALDVAETDALLGLNEQARQLAEKGLSRAPPVQRFKCMVSW